MKARKLKLVISVGSSKKQQFCAIYRSIYLITSQSKSCPDVPNQSEDVSFITLQILASRTLRFQRKWFQDFPWLHFDASVDGILCFYCCSASNQGLASLDRCKKDTFAVGGFKNWKNARDKFEGHSKSKAPMDDLKFQTQPAIIPQIFSQVQDDQLISRKAFLTIFGSIRYFFLLAYSCIKCSIRYLAQQGLSLRGKEADEGNLFKLLQLLAEYDVNIKQWMEKRVTWNEKDHSPRGIP